MRRILGGADPDRGAGRLHRGAGVDARLGAGGGGAAAAPARRQARGGRAVEWGGGSHRRRPPSAAGRGLYRERVVRTPNPGGDPAGGNRACRCGAGDGRVDRRGGDARRRPALPHRTVHHRRFVAARGHRPGRPAESVPVRARRGAVPGRACRVCLQPARLAAGGHRSGGRADGLGIGGSLHRPVLRPRRQGRSRVDAGLLRHRPAARPSAQVGGRRRHVRGLRLGCPGGISPGLRQPPPRRAPQPADVAVVLPAD